MYKIVIVGDLKPILQMYHLVDTTLNDLLVNLTRLFGDIDVSIINAVNQDIPSQQEIEQLAMCNVQLHQVYVKARSGKTDLRADDIVTYGDLIAQADLVLTHLNIAQDVIVRSFYLAQKYGTKTMLMTGALSESQEVDLRIFASTDILWTNQQQIQFLWGDNGANSLSERIYALGIKQVISVLSDTYTVYRDGKLDAVYNEHSLNLLVKQVFQKITRN